MNNYKYRWILRKGSRKDVCPACGKKRFVPYVSAADGETPAGADYGRCDRENSCGYYRYPSGLGDSKKIERAPEKELPTLLIKKSVMDADGVNDCNSLLIAYRGMLHNIEEVMRLYHCGTGSNGECVYYQFDGENVRTAKAIMYGSDGHRKKNDDGRLPVWWLHRSRKEWRDGYKIRQCLFGQHLLNGNDFPVIVVEAEKTAILMAARQLIAGGEHVIFVAAGGSQLLKGAIDLSPLNGREVTLLPDDGQFWNWKKTADMYGWKCVNIERITPPDMRGADIWDLIEKEILVTI